MNARHPHARSRWALRPSSAAAIGLLLGVSSCSTSGLNAGAGSDGANQDEASGGSSSGGNSSGSNSSGVGDASTGSGGGYDGGAESSRGGGHEDGAGGSSGDGGSDGWTVFTPVTGTGSCSDSSGDYTGTCIVFVSSSTGNDATCAAELPTVTGPAAGHACATLAKGISLLRPGASADWLLLNRGDTFPNQDFYTLCAQHGTSPMAPLLISAYGSGARPIVEPDPTDAWPLGSYGGGGCAAGGDDLAVVSVEIYNPWEDPSNPAFNMTDIVSNPNGGVGTFFLNPISWLLIEDCLFEFAPIVIEPTAQSTNVTIRRSEVLDAYSATQAHASGAFIASINDLVLEENIFDNNGWNGTVAGAGSTIFNHNIYLAASDGPLTLIGNISSNAADGDQLRSGGTITDNAFIRMPYGHNVGQPYAGSPTLVNDNVHIEQVVNDENGGTGNAAGTICAFSTYEGQAFNLAAATYEGNIIVHAGDPSLNVPAIDIDPDQTGSVLKNNIACDWSQKGSTALFLDESGVSTLVGNYQNNADCDHNGYPSPDRTVGTYDTSLGTGSCNGNTVGTTANFLCKARQQSKTHWSTALTADAFNNYIRAGFGM